MVKGFTLLLNEQELHWLSPSQKFVTRLIEYANKAGLCLATCWDLDELYNANAAEETERWIRDSQTEDEREEKQAVANIVRVKGSGKNE
jgi:hypothetical protein